MTNSGGLRPPDFVRVSRDERERCIDELQEQYAAGRLGEQELGDRVDAALRATTRADLRVLVADLPSGQATTVARGRGRAFLITSCGVLAAGVLGLGALGVARPSPTPPEIRDQTICLSTGEATVPDHGCPEVSKIQQQIFDDADAADRAAQQLSEIADRNPQAQLNGLLERAVASSGRANDAAERSRQIVLVADGEPAEKVMAKAAEAGEKAAEATQRTLDAALDRLDGG